MKYKFVFWSSLVWWGILAVLMTLFATQHMKINTDLSYFWCGVVGLSCGIGVIFSPLVTMINLFFTIEEM